MNYRLVVTTCPDPAAAEALARPLVEGGLAACVTIVPGALSLYEWEGKVQREQECLLFIKTRSDRYKPVETTIRENHPYELPEVIAVPIEAGLPDYLAWIDHQLTRNRS